MKLHLPTGLRAALIAALTAVGFTLTQAAAAETQLDVSPTEKTGGNTPITWTGGDATLNSWKLTFDLTVTDGTANDFFNISSNHGTAQAGWALGVNGTTLRLAYGGKNQTAVIALDNAFELNQSQPVTFQFERNVDETGVSLGTGTFTVIAGELTQTYTVDSLTDTALAPGSNGKGHIWCNGNPGGKQQLRNIVLYQLDDKKVKESGYTWNASEAGNSSWNLTSQIWLNEDSQPVSYVSGGNAFFTKDANYKTVTIGENISAGKISVSDNYTFTMSGSSALTATKLTITSGSTLTVNGTGSVSTGELINKGTLSIGSGARVASSSTPVEVAAGDTFTVTGAGILELATMRSKGGTINISSNLAVTGGGDGTMGNNQNGLCINGGAGGAINIMGGVTTVTGAVYTGGGSTETQLNVGSETAAATLVTTRLELGDTNGSTGTFTIGKKGKVVIQGAENVRSDQANPQKKTSLQLAEWNQVVTSTINGKLYAENAIAFMSNDASSTVNIAGGTMAVKGIATTNATSARAHTFTMDGGKLILGDTGITEEPGAWTISFANGEIGTYAGSTVVGRSFTTSGDLTFNTAMYTWTGDDDSKKIEAGEAAATITVSGNITGDGTIIKTGDGTLMLAGDNNALTHTINLQKGTLDVTTAVLDISNMSGITTKEYSDGQVTGNGFATRGGTVHVVAVGEGAILSHEGAQVTFEGTDVTMDDNGDVVLEDAKSLTTFYVNVNGSTESLANAVTKGGGELTTVSLADNTKLAADQAADLGALVVRTDASAGVELSKDVAFDTLTVTTKDKTLTLTGAGTLSAGVLNGPGTISIGDDAVLSVTTATVGTAKPVVTGGGTLAVTNGTLTAELADTWTGTVRVADTTRQDGNNAWIDTLANENSLVEFIHFTGYDRAWASSYVSEIAANIKLTSDGTNAAWNLSAFASSTYTMVLTGDWQGDGTFLMAGGSAGQSQAVEYKGDITNWTGSIEVNAPGMRRVTFSENATAVNVSLVNNGSGAFELVVNNAATFSKEVNVSKLTVNADKSATFQADTTVGQLAGSGSIVKTGTDTTMTVTAPTGTGTTAAMLDISVNEGTLKATAANALGSGDITVAENATLDLTNGGALGATQTVANSGNVLLHSTLTQGAVNGGKLTIASDFPSDGEILDVDGTDTGNGFSQGGAVQVYDTAHASLSDDIDIVHGENHYALTDLTNGAITLSGADWNTYQLNVDAQYTVQEIMDYAKANEGELKTISVNADMLTIENDSATLKTSMLGGEHLATFAVYMSGVSGLTIDGDCGAAITTNTGAEGAVTLTKDATVGSIVAGDFENGGAGNLTINGEGHTVKADGAGAAFGGVLALGKGVTLELLHDTSFTTMQNATVKLGESASLVLNEVSFSTVEGGTGATIIVTSDDYLPMYDPSFAEYSITGARITYTTSANFDLGHVIDATSQVVNKGTGSLRDISTNEKYAELNAEGGDIFISTAEDAGTDERALIVGNLTLAAGRTVGEDTGKAVTITVTDTASFGSGSTVSSALTMAGGTTLNADGPVALGTHALTLEKDINIGDTLWSTLNALAPEASTNIFTGVRALTLAGAEYTGEVDLNDIFNHTSLQAHKYTLSFEDGNVIITRNKDNDRYWKGGDGTWNTADTIWTDQESGGNDVAFVNEYNAHFAAASGGTITLGENITAANVYVTGADYTFVANGHTLTVNNAFEVDGYTATLQGLGLNGADLKLTAKNGGTLKLGADSSVKDVEIGTDSAITANGSTLTVADSFVNSGSLTAGTLTLTQGTAQGGKVTVTKLNLTSGQSYTFNVLTAPTISGTGADLTISDYGSLAATNTATLKNLTTGEGAQLDGNITVTGNTNAGVDTTISGSLTGGPVMVDDSNLTLTSNGSLGLVQFSGTSSLTASGTATVTLDALLVNSDELTLTGKFDASNLGASKSDSKYVEGGTDGNGFEQARLTLTIVNGGTTSADGATIVYRGKDLTEKVGTNGKVTFDGDVDYTKFYVNSGTENASTAMNNAKWTATSSFELNSNTTLVVDHEGISLGMVNMPAGAALLQIESGYTVATDGSSKNLMLTGAGELAVDAGKDTPGVVYHASQWTGTVSLRDVELTQLDSDWGTANSTVALQNASGALGNAEVKYDLELRKGAGDSWGYGGTSSTKDSHLWLKGDLKGDGDLGVKSGTATSVFELNGNTDAWTGNFVANNANATLKLTGDDKTVNGTVTGSNLALVVETNATLKSDSTVARVNATAGSLKVDAGKRLTVTDTILPDNIKLGAGASIAAAFMGGIEYGYMDGTIANETGGDQAVTISNADITVTGATLCTNGGTGFTVNNKLVDAKLLVAETLTKAVALNNVQDSLEVVDDLAIGTHGSLKVAKTNGAEKQLVNISSGTLTLANGATMDANLAIGTGVTLAFNYDQASPVAATLSGGSLDLANSLTLSGDLYKQMAEFTDADDEKVVVLFQNVGALTLGGAAYEGEVSAQQYFTNLTDLSDLGDFTLLYNDSTDTVSIRFDVSSAKTLTWNGTAGEHDWLPGDDTMLNWETTAQQPAYFEQGDNAKFTKAEAYQEVTIAEGRTETRNLTISGEDAQYAFVVGNGTSTIASSNLMKVTEGASLSKRGEGDLVLELNAALAVENSTLAVEEGSLYIGGASRELNLKNSALDIADSASLIAGTIKGDADSTIIMGRESLLNTDGGSIQSLQAGEDSTLAITGGTLTIAEDTIVYNLVSTGTLDLGTKDLTLAESTTDGGNVTAGTLNLAEDGSTFGNLKVNTIHYAYDKEGAGTLDYVAVDTIVSNGADKITLDLTDVRGDGGSLAPIQRLDEGTTYTLVYAGSQALNADNFTLDAATQEALVQNGLIQAGAGLEVNEDNDGILQLTIGGQNLTWYTDKDVTEWGYQVVSGDALTAGGNTLNGVEHVVVDASRRIDVTGAGSAPGLRVRNITGLDGRTITFTGTEDDTVNLITSEETASNVNVAAENITLKVGLDELDEMDPVDYKDLRVGDVNLTSATLDVHDHEGLDDSFTVNSLNGDSASQLKGTLIVEGQGGTYNGGYEGATVILHKDADQALAAGEGLTVMGLGLARITYSGTETHMDGIEGIGLRVMLNDVETDNSHRTLTLDNEFSYIVDGALGVGLSAIESGLTLDSEAAPDLLRAEHLDMSGSTLYIYQPASDGDTLTMDVNDGGYKRGLLLANLGADDTTADAVQLIGDLYNKYYQNARLQNGRVLVDRRTDYFSSITEPTSENGRAGAGMLDDALLYNNPQVTQAGGDLAVVMTALEKGGYTHDRADKVMAAMSGASHAALGAAWSHDVDRQLRAIRNRTSQMGLAECEVHEDLPYVNAWINAEGDYHKLDSDGLMPGYKMSSWGGTVGFDVDCTPRFTFGAAVTAMSGDFTACSEDMAKGDLDRMYVSVFGRYSRRAWTHTLVFTYGSADTKIDRTVDFVTGRYDGTTESDGSAWGLMYELGYVTALNEGATVCLQPIVNVSYRQSKLNGATETGGSDAALETGDAEAKLFTAAVGARLQSTMGTNIYNRASLFEGRVLFKFETGDRAVDARNSFVGVPGGRTVKGAEAGLFGVEVGAGLTIPLSENAGALFFDVTGDFRAKDTEFNGTVGYRYNF